MWNHTISLNLWISSQICKATHLHRAWSDPSFFCDGFLSPYPDCTKASKTIRFAFYQPMGENLCFLNNTVSNPTPPYTNEQQNNPATRSPRVHLQRTVLVNKVQRCFLKYCPTFVHPPGVRPRGRGNRSSSLVQEWNTLSHWFMIVKPLFSRSFSLAKFSTALFLIGS